MTLRVLVTVLVGGVKGSSTNYMNKLLSEAEREQFLKVGVNPELEVQVAASVTLQVHKLLSNAERSSDAEREQAAQ